MVPARTSCTMHSSSSLFSWHLFGVRSTSLVSKKYTAPLYSILVCSVLCLIFFQVIGVLSQLVLLLVVPECNEHGANKQTDHKAYAQHASNYDPSGGGGVCSAGGRARFSHLRMLNAGNQRSVDVY